MPRDQRLRPWPYRLFIKGVPRTTVTQYTSASGNQGYHEEDEIGFFFYNAGCTISEGGVRLMIDQITSKCRGFAFVDLKDENSYKKALALGPASPWTVEAAKPVSEKSISKHAELTDARDKTEGMQRDLRFLEANVKKPSRQLTITDIRQQALDKPAETEDIGEQLRAERARQEQFKTGTQNLADVEKVLAGALREEEKRMRALENIAVSVDGEQTDRSRENGAVSFHIEEGGGEGGEDRALARLPSESPKFGEGDQLVDIRVKNTFIEYFMPPMAIELIRTKTAPAVFQFSEDAEKREDSAS